MSYTWPETLTFGASKGEASRQERRPVPAGDRRPHLLELARGGTVAAGVHAGLHHLEELTFTFIGEGLA
jgi:hypothetical protein